MHMLMLIRTITGCVPRMHNSRILDDACMLYIFMLYTTKKKIEEEHLN